MAHALRRFHAYLVLRRHLGWTVAEIDALPDETVDDVLYVINRPEPPA